MGNLLRVLNPSRDDNSLARVDIFVDFENCKASENELAIFGQVSHVLGSTATILHELQLYKGAANEIREAINKPQDKDFQDKAWNAVVPLVLQLKRYFEFSTSLEHIVPKLLGQLCSNEMTPKQHLETQQALFKQFAEMLDFVLKFDDLKMTNPAIQNDFSYYRRTLNRMRLSRGDSQGAEASGNQQNGGVETQNLEVTDDVANRMSLFYAHATPMLKVLSDTTTRFVSENKDLPIENTTDCLSTMAQICRTMIENPNYRSKIQEETIMFCLRVMVGVIILYDHVHHVGAFSKSSTIDMKSSIKVLKDQPPAKVEGLLNALRYTTKHLNDESTPKSIKSLLA